MQVHFRKFFALRTAMVALPVPVRGEGKSLSLLKSACGVSWFFLRIVLCDSTSL